MYFRAAEVAPVLLKLGLHKLAQTTMEEKS
jgi:hypothetical protein